MDWKIEGCYKEEYRLKLKVLPNKFATVRGVNAQNPDIEKVYNKCKAKAEINGYEMFAIRVRMNYSVSSLTIEDPD